MDLSALADDIEDGELLSGEGDAPVIRLINAILSQAVTEKPPIFTLSPMKIASPSASVWTVY